MMKRETGNENNCFMKCISIKSFSRKLTIINPAENTFIFPALKVFRGSG